MELARIALSKSSNLLHDCVTDAQLLMTNFKAVVTNFVDAALYAECFALHAVYQSASSAGPSEYQSSNLSVQELQQALLIDPENLIARKGLGLKCEKRQKIFFF
jgi:hypothetical protein